MDRLICGDVGFGKTEVALRAAFIAAMSGMQVAVIAPTTLLARQHAKTFAERFAGTGLRVRQLSRFVAAKEAAETPQGPGGRLGRDRRRHARAAREVREVLQARPPRHRRGAAFRRHPQGAAEAAPRRRPRPDDDRDADPAHAAARDVGRARAVGHRDAAGRPPRGPHLRLALRHRHRSARRCCASAIAAGRRSSSCRASPTCPRPRSS